MNFTTLCYIEKENKYLMLHRTSKKKDGNKDKWIGVGGHFEKGESPEVLSVFLLSEDFSCVLKRKLINSELLFPLIFFSITA